MHFTSIVALLGLTTLSLANPILDERAAKCPKNVKANGCNHPVKCNSIVTDAGSTNDYGTTATLQACVAKCTYDTGCAISQWIRSSGACTGYNDVVGFGTQAGAYTASHSVKCTN